MERSDIKYAAIALLGVAIALAILATTSSNRSPGLRVLAVISAVINALLMILFVTNE